VEQKREGWARVGVTLLNLVVPGLGLLRIGNWIMATAFYAVTLSVLFFAYAGPPVGFSLLAAILLIGLAVYPTVMAATWYRSSVIAQPMAWYSRWYVLVGATLIALATSYALTDEQSVRYRSFFTPAESMAPTLPTGDRFFAYMRMPKQLRRGDLLLVRAPGGRAYVKRLAALPGDVIGLTNGVIMLNGKPVAQQFVGSESIADLGGTVQGRRMKERFPGELGSHEIYDLGESVGDDFQPYQVRPGHVFLLGDNRDRSADSRFSHEEMGLEEPPMADILGWPLYHSFGSSRPMGELINRKDMQ
jgi:signal peptidase I